MTVASVRQVTVPGLDGFSDGWFTHGLVTFTSGSHAGRASEVKRHWLASGVVTLELWAAMPSLPLVGDAFTITAGCDRHFATCRTKFANAANYRGFPHMPGNDTLAAYVRGGSNGSSTLST